MLFFLVQFALFILTHKSAFAPIKLILSQFLLYSFTFCSPKNNGTLYQLIWFWGKIFPNTISIKQSQIPPPSSLHFVCNSLTPRWLSYRQKFWVQLYQFWKLTQNSSSILMVWDLDQLSLHSLRKGGCFERNCRVRKVAEGNGKYYLTFGFVLWVFYVKTQLPRKTYDFKQVESIACNSKTLKNAERLKLW